MVKLALAAGFVFASVTNAHAQQGGNHDLCSLYFKARAEWLRTGDGDPATIRTMENYADILWDAVPRDDGINRLVPPPQEDNTITDFMTRWAEKGGQLPLCMEDAVCQTCTDLLLKATR